MLFTFFNETSYLKEDTNQGDQKIGKKFAQILEKVAKTVAKPKETKIISSKLNLTKTTTSNLF
jgi:hypothetical protein